MGKSRVVIVGAGIIGLATAYELVLRGHEVTVVEKEKTIAGHQTGNNSGVIHSGLYYAPGSLKAKMGQTGSQSMKDFARDNGVTLQVGGKLVVATKASQIPALAELYRRGQANGVPCRMISPEVAREYEPHISALAALRVESTASVDYRGICEVLEKRIIARGGEILLRQRVVGVTTTGDGVTVSTTAGEVRGDQFVNCAGLYSDRIARLAGLKPDVRIIPFRGEYFELTPDSAPLINGLVYPVPDPRLPFLGVHFTRMFNGTVHAGPNAVFALAREGYRWRDINPRDIVESAAWPGLWSLGKKFWRSGLDEVLRSVSRKRFVASLRELVPDLPENGIVPTHAGVRAQAISRDGRLVDDFHFQRAPRQIHVLNAPSPAATASLEIAKYIADELAAME